MPNQDCSIEGNSNFYGLGLRIGLYLTIIASWLSKLFLREVFSSMQISTLALLLANLIALCSAARDPDADLYAVEGCVMFYLLIMQFMPAASLPKGKWMGGLDLPSALLFFLSIAFKPLWAWYWIKGVYFWKPMPCGKAYAFFFAPVNLVGGFRIVMIIIWVALSVWSIRNLYRFFQNCGYKSETNAEDMPGIMEDELQQLYQAPFSFFVSLLAVELTIHFNHIKGVHSLRSTSQLIPFVVGLGQLLFVIFQMRFGDTDISELSFQPLSADLRARMKLGSAMSRAYQFGR